jgi:hypothetical protein
VFKRYMKERENLTSEPGEETPASEEAEQLYFAWKQTVRRYKKMSSLSPVVG